MKAIETTAKILSDGVIIPQTRFCSIPPGQYRAVIIIDDHGHEQISSDVSHDEIDTILSSLASEGLMRSSKKTANEPPDPVSREERRRLADILGKAPGKSLSEIIIEERGAA